MWDFIKNTPYIVADGRMVAYTKKVLQVPNLLTIMLTCNAAERGRRLLNRPGKKPDLPQGVELNEEVACKYAEDRDRWDEDRLWERWQFRIYDPENYDFCFPTDGMTPEVQVCRLLEEISRRGFEIVPKPS